MRQLGIDAGEGLRSHAGRLTALDVVLTRAILANAANALGSSSFGHVRSTIEELVGMDGRGRGA